MAFNLTYSHSCSQHGVYYPTVGCVCDKGWTGASRDLMAVSSFLRSCYQMKASSCKKLTCITDLLFSGLGDFSPKAGLHCDINQALVTDTYIYILCSNAACMLLTIRYLLVRCIEKRSIFIVTLDPKSIFPFFFLASQIVGTALCSLKIIDRDQQIVGRDVVITFLGACLPLFAQWGLVIYFFVVIRCLKSYTTMMTAERSERVAKRFALFSRVCLMIPPTSFAYSMIPLVGLPYPFYERTFAIIYLIGNGINAWLFGALTSLSLRFLLKELRSQVELFPKTSRDIKQVLRRLTYAYYVIVSMSFIIGASYVIFGSFSYLLVKSTYLLIFQQLTCPPSSTILILTVSRISPTNDRLNNFSRKSLIKLKPLPGIIVESTVESGDRSGGDSGSSPIEPV